jgi:AAA domain, putative AbiEii toxin, Type IV TA system
MSGAKLFEVVSRLPNRRPGRRLFILLRDTWDDWFKYETTFQLFMDDETGHRSQIGSVKIGRIGMTPKDRKPPIPDTFDALDSAFFSVGQSDDYYETIAGLSSGFGRIVFEALRDCAYDPTTFQKARHEDVMRTSLLRGVSSQRVNGRFHNLAHGRVEPTSFGFCYRFFANSPEPKLRFEVVPKSLPPTNIHVLIGRNGVGKTRLLDRCTRALLGIPPSDGREAASLDFDDGEKNGTFANVISVSFSAFDPFGPILPNDIPTGGITYAYLGLKKQRSDPGQPYESKGRSELQREFVQAVQTCRTAARLSRWQQALETLESDPLFEEADVSRLIDMPDDRLEETAAKLFEKLSSGHGIVLLSITRLVELVDERSLVLLDEPEGHLHPPLLSAFVRALSQLLTLRNGVAVIATHSPVVLQEVPAVCVWTITRSREEVRVDRPEIETFGENVGLLTREVFGLEVQRSGFHTLLAREIAASNGNYEAVIEAFAGQLGAEARAILRGMALTYNPNDRL